jgi:hypothetical protein
LQRSIGLGISMKQQCQQTGPWVHVFNENSFGGRLRQLGLGEKEDARKVGSIVVGPNARASIVDGSGREIARLLPGKIIDDFSKLKLKRRAIRIHVKSA